MSVEQFCTTPFGELKEQEGRTTMNNYSLAKRCFTGLFLYKLLTKG